MGVRQDGGQEGVLVGDSGVPDALAAQIGGAADVL